MPKTKEEKRVYMKEYRAKNGKGYLIDLQNKKQKIECPICSILVCKGAIARHKQSPKCQLQQQINDLTQQLTTANM